MNPSFFCYVILLLLYWRVSSFQILLTVVCVSTGPQRSCDLHHHQRGRRQFQSRPWIRWSDGHQKTGPGAPFQVFPSGARWWWAAVIWHEAEHHGQGCQRPYAEVLTHDVLIRHPWGHGSRWSITVKFYLYNRQLCSSTAIKHCNAKHVSVTQCLSSAKSFSSTAVDRVKPQMLIYV